MSAPSGPVEVRLEVAPSWTFHLPRRGGMDGVMRVRAGGVIERLIHFDDSQAVVVRAAHTADGRVIFGGWARTRSAAEHGIARMRFALGVDDDLRPFHRRFADDPLIGRSVRARPWLRVARRPQPFEALAWAICEQLIEYERAAAIERRVVARLGRRDPGGSGLRDLPTPATVAGVAPARLQSFDLSAGRALALRRAAREIAAGRIDLDAEDHDGAWRRLRAIAGIGSWTVAILALQGQGRYDQAPAGDVGLMKAVGRALSGGDPRARACESEVRDALAPYGEWAGLAACHLLAV